jgi:hypothetical protein
VAAKYKAPAKKPKAAVVTKAKAAPKGLGLTTAQRNAYNKAFSATATSLRRKTAIQNIATTRRKSLLSAAHSVTSSYNKARARAQTAAIAAYASHRSAVQSKLAHQNSALMLRIEANAAHHATLAVRLQYAQAGEKAYAHHAVISTVTQKQAVSYATALYSKINAASRKAAKSTVKYNQTATSKAITAAATSAGMKAAAKVKTRTAPRFPGIPGVAPKRKPGPLKWLGDEFTPNCIVTAVANHLLNAKGVTADDESIRELTKACPPDPVIEEVLWQAYMLHFPRNSIVHLAKYWPLELPVTNVFTPLLVGYETMTEDGPADHCALSLATGKVVSWGAVRERDGEIEEAWELRWQD